jgi:hypothetical protein
MPTSPPEPMIEHPRDLGLGPVEQLRLPPEWVGDLARVLQVDGCPVRVDARPRIASLRGDGLGPTAIARRLNAAGIPTPSGLLGRWRPETVLRVERPERWSAYMRAYRRRRA